MTGILITVYENNNTYTARANGKVASCTAGDIRAANACARKIFTEPFDLKREKDDRRFYTKWLAIPRTTQ